MRPSKKRPTSSEDTSLFFETSHFGRAFRKRVQDYAHEKSLFHEKIRILVALSGGPDSTALFHVLLSLRKRLEIDLFAAHVNYRLRGDDSEKDETFVRTLCDRYHVPLSVIRPKNATGKNEEVLRDIRYRFFEQTRKALGCDLIAIAHNRDDQAETLLIRLLRGTGPEGLAGIRPKNAAIIRPLLEMPRENILRYLKEEGLRFRIDRSNRDTRILRNRIRAKLLPTLEREYQPNIRSILARTARILGKSDKKSRISYETANGTGLPIPIDTDQVSFSRKGFLALTESERSEILRTLAKTVSKDGKSPSEAFVREAVKAIGSTKGKERTVRTGQLKISARGDRVILIRK